jgi:hypothetical protein
MDAASRGPLRRLLRALRPHDSDDDAATKIVIGAPPGLGGSIPSSKPRLRLPCASDNSVHTRELEIASSHDQTAPGAKQCSTFPMQSNRQRKSRQTDDCRHCPADPGERCCATE